jgi:hypothetical protein
MGWGEDRVLKLDRPAGGRDGSHDQRRNMTCAERESAR